MYVKNRQFLYMIVKKVLTKLILLFSIFLLFAGNCVYAQSHLTKIERVCIDAGHGGKDPGAVNGSIHEKNITLSLALKLGKAIKQKYPDIEVIYTRKTDVFVDLKKRSQIANNSKADLFISIHLNSVDGNSSVRGIETLVLGSNSSEQNMRTAMRENSALKYESDYSVIRETFDPNKPESYIIFNLIRNVHLNESLLFASLAQDAMVKNTGWKDRKVKQQPVWVLKDASMPAVLVEVGFISNPTESKALKSESGQNNIVKSLLTAFGEYKNRMESNKSVLNEERVAPATQKESAKQKAATPVTKVEDKGAQKEQVKPVESKVVVPVKKEESKVETTVNKVVEQPKRSEEPISLQSVKEEEWFYAIQIGNLSEPVKSSSVFGVSETVNCIVDGNRYKYYICKTKLYSEVSEKAKAIRTKINGAFVIGVKGGKIVSAAELRPLESKK